MKVEIIFTGLCSFLNVRDNHGDSMVEPSIILVRTDIDVDPGIPGPGYQEGRNPEEEEENEVAQPAVEKECPDTHIGHDEHEHVPFIAYNTAELNSTFDKFEDIPNAKGFRMFRLPMGVELTFDGMARGNPEVVQSYDTIAKKDVYWPEAKNRWNRNYVPKKGGKPDSSVVAAFMRFGKGFIGGGRLCPLEWSFIDESTRRVTNQFAEEGLYTFDQKDGEIVFRIASLDSTADPIEIRFQPIKKDGQFPDQILFIGNTMKTDIARYVLRTEADAYFDGDHFRFLNAVANIGDGPFPAFGRRVTSGCGGGGGSTSGACGPHSSNG
ncbi:MAG: hypothetical protein JOZ54_23420 [Acidobacteria bacterium]|nr:hypothetical protein [Acidobacteriota bacterium]